MWLVFPKNKILDSQNVSFIDDCSSLQITERNRRISYQKMQHNFGYPTRNGFSKMFADENVVSKIVNCNIFKNNFQIVSGQSMGFVPSSFSLTKERGWTTGDSVAEPWILMVALQFYAINKFNSVSEIFCQIKRLFNQLQQLALKLRILLHQKALHELPTSLTNKNISQKGELKLLILEVGVKNLLQYFQIKCAKL